MNMRIFMVTFLLMSSSLFSQENFDEYIAVYRQDDNGDFFEDSILECTLSIHDVRIGMTQDQVKEITGNPKDAIVLTQQKSEKSLEIWNYKHQENIDHSVEFEDGIVKNVIADYEAYQNEIKNLLKEDDVKVE